MNYYEELGIRPEADEEEIRKAHRRLVKLMHPDHQRDQGLKQLAETQMRRLNSIVATLLDPDERSEYDEQLRGGSEVQNGAITPQSSWRSIPLWIGSTLGAIVLTIGAIWFWADRIGSGPSHALVINGPDGGTVERPEVKASVRPARPVPEHPGEGTDPNTTVAAVPPSKPEIVKPEPTKVEPAKVEPPKPQVVAKVEPPKAELSKSVAPKPEPTKPEPPKKVEQAKVEIPKPAVSKQPVQQASVSKPQPSLPLTAAAPVPAKKTAALPPPPVVIPAPNKAVAKVIAPATNKTAAATPPLPSLPIKRTESPKETLTRVKENLPKANAPKLSEATKPAPKTAAPPAKETIVATNYPKFVAVAPAPIKPSTKSTWDNRLQAPGAAVDVASIPHDVAPPVMEAAAPPPLIAPISKAVGSHDPLEGEWVYAPSEPEKRKSGFYPPEYIKLKLTKDTQGMHGQYSARYNVADSRPVSPEVAFTLKSVDKTSRKYVWTAPDGSKGTLAIRTLEPDIMRLEWHTTNLRTGPALTSGMATLVRNRQTTN